MPSQIHTNPFIIRPPDDLVRNNLELKNMSRRLATKYADGQVVTDDDLQIMGRMLWSSLNIQKDFNVAQGGTETAILPVVVESGAADVQALPWETLFHPTHGFIGKNPAFTLTRRLSAKREAVSPLDKGPLRVLLFTSLPDDVNPETGRLNVEEEQFQVQEALLPWISKGLAQLEMPDDGRFSTFKELLKSFQPHVLFLSGHGRFHHEPHTGEAPYGEFLFESEVGDGEAIKEDDIANALIGMGMQAVVLSTCESGKVASDALSNGSMRKISAQGIPHVIGIRESILDRAGIQFARALCDALANQEYIDFALQCARNDVSATDERGQWCLPMLISSHPHAPLIDWDFQPKEIDGARVFKNTLGDVNLPAGFIGRRAEMRQYKNRLFKGEFYKLLITGPGGQGKTSLAGKLALDMKKRGWQVFAWSASLEKSWRDFELEMEQTLEKPRVDRYNQFLPRAENEVERAKFMLSLLMEQFNGRVILFLDNLESLQDPQALTVQDTLVAAWMDAAQEIQDLILFATSRWQIPDWDGENLMLVHANYGDFLQMAQGFQLPSSMLERRSELRHVYDVLGGNCRGLEFFVAAVRDMQNAEEEHAFLAALAHTKADLQANMAIEEIYKRLPPDAQKLLGRLPAYHEPVPLEGLVKMGSDLLNPEALLERLLAVSLLEAGYELPWNVIQYQCAPMVENWMRDRGLIQENADWLNVAADYHVYLFNNERKSLFQAMTTHHAIRRAERHPEADRLTLDYVVRPLEIAGFYINLLNDWLPKICDSEDPQTCGDALNITGQLYFHLGDYEMAMSCLKQSLTIRQQVGDKVGEGVALGIIGHIYQSQSDYEIALSYLKRSLAISQEIDDKECEGTTLLGIGNIYYAQGDYETALSCLKQALTIQQKIGDKTNESTTLNNISQIFQAQGDFDTAISYLKRALVFQQKIGLKVGEEQSLNNISQIYQAQGNYDTALSYLKRALAIALQISDKIGESSTLNNIGNTYLAQGDSEMALSYLEKSLVIRRQIGNEAGAGITLNNISQIYKAQGDYEAALSYLKQALSIQQKIGDIKGESVSLNNISQILQARGEYDNALVYSKKDLSICQRIGDRAGEGVAFNNISGIYWELGNHETALSYLKQSLTITQQIGDKASEGRALTNISQIYHDQGDYETALTYLQQSLTIQQQIGDKKGEGRSINNFSRIFIVLGDYKTALTYLQRSIAIQQQIGDKEGEGNALNNISQIYMEQGDYETALSYLKQSLAIQQKIGDKAGLCLALFNMGHVHAQNNKMQEAVNIWVASYIIAKQINLAQALQELADLAPQLGLPDGLESWEMLAQKMQNKKDQ